MKKFTDDQKKEYAEQQKEKINSALKQLEDGVKAMFDSGRYADFLKFMAMFHRYSWRNTILIMSQMPTASNVASYDDWHKKFNRHVVKGAKAIKVLVPAPKKYTKTVKRVSDDGTVTEEEKECTAMHFRIGNVFDVSQTEGDDLRTADMER